MTFVRKHALAILAWVVVLAIIIGGGCLLWVGIPWIVRELGHLYTASGTEFKLGLLTAVLSAAGLIWSVLYQKRRELEALQFERKREAYSAFFNFLFEILKANDEGVDPLADPDMKDKWRDLTKQMMIWADATTINAFNFFQRESLAPTDDLKVTFDRVERLMRAFRRDLGHRDRRLERFGLTKLIVKGDEHHKMD